MNEKLINKIEYYGLNADTNKSTIRTFLNTCITTNMYKEVKGDDMSDKVEFIYNYLNNIIKEPEVKSPLNIVIADDSSSLEYVSYLNEKYDVIVHKTKDVVDVKTIDLVLFTGGEDVNPERYYEKVGKYTSINAVRDEKEIDTYYRFNGHCLLLGICRGNQLLTVLSGGKLIQHVEGHGRDHFMMVRDVRYKITSSHHQMIYPFDLSERDYELIAHSEYFQSNTYLNGNNEETELSKNFLEPEIVYYKNTNALCIQGHPEWSHCTKRTSNMCLNLIDKYLKEFQSDKKTMKSHYIPSPPINLNDEDEEGGDWYEEDVHEEEIPL